MKSQNTIMWIPVAKVASTSIASVIGRTQHDLVFAFVRHPFDRACSAVCSTLRNRRLPNESIEEQIRRLVDNPHIRPQREILDYWWSRMGFIGIFENISADWKRLQSLIPVGDLPHLNKTENKVDWRSLNWSDLMPRFEQDFELCKDWTM